MIRTPKPKKYANERILEFEDGQNTIIDLDMLYGVEPKTNIPGFDRREKEMFKQILIDLTDLSLNEYTMHYICHSEVKLGSPYESIRDNIESQLTDFFKYSVSKMPFSLWSEVISEHSQILMNVLPLTLQKELTDLRFKFTKKYIKNRLKKLQKEFEKRKFKLCIPFKFYFIVASFNIYTITSYAMKPSQQIFIMIGYTHQNRILVFQI